jgi:hypothetical protein
MRADAEADDVTTEAEMVDRAVIMISPFSEPPTFLAEGRPPAEVVAVLQTPYPP